MTLLQDRPEHIGQPRDCSFHPSDWKVLSQSWFAVASAEEIVDKPVKARLLDIDLVVYRTGGAVRVDRDLCAHRGAALSLGWVEGDILVCNLQIFNKDRLIVESQRPEDLPLEAQLEAHIPADRTSIAYHRLLKEGGLGSHHVS